jgi:hypothetical protein
MIRGRSNVVTLTNNSGGALVAGDVCVQDTAGDEYVTTTTSAASVLKVFIAAESIAGAAAGRFYASGYCPLVTPSASTTRGRYLFTHTVAKQAAENATYGTGAFGVILKSGTTPSVWLFGSTAQGSGGVARSGATTDGHLAVWNGSSADSIKDGGAIGAGGAATTDHFVTTAAESDLSAEVAIPGLAGSADILGAAGAGTSEEYDTATTGLTWGSAPTTEDSNTTVKSHLYVADSNATTKYGVKAWAPAGAFDARAKIAIGAEQATSGYEFSLIVVDSGTVPTNGAALLFTANVNGGYLVQAFTIASTSFTQRGSTATTHVNPVYLRITRDGSNNVKFYYSENGITWKFIVTQNHTFTVAKIGYRISSGDAASHYGIVDWLRTSV